jgi:hypothetical protein
MKIAEDEKNENAIDDSMLLDLTVCYHSISFLPNISHSFID